MEDERVEPGLRMLDRQAIRLPAAPRGVASPPGGTGAPARSVPGTKRMSAR
ncbi:MAG: hypothetical protein ABIG85_04390 [Chloroflexota bacterium]